MAAIRVPTTTIHRLLTTTRTLPSSLPRLSQRIQVQTTPFSTTRAVRSSGSPNMNANANANGNPSYPAFSLKRIAPNPRVRAALYGAFVFLAAAEGYMWVTYGPRIMGWETKEGGEKKE
ncbi:hypothetical protein C8A01DRAFT_38940 [Parachaetomium inaequale]|uniref:Uncharacterized protein n=1 Tax=Parachaetomium inaequale TaxID=2588326 RepID=A0AAN6SN73_9PEZI|nr:hypothetical protein C8A01DRAFT_38940 [Parachaetomium inaequale]